MSKILNAINIGGEKYVFGGSSVEGDFYRNSSTLSVVPDTSTLTDTSGNAFDIGQTVRVPASVAGVSDSITGYIFYRLAAIDGNNRAIWEQLDEGTVEIPETITVHITSNLATTDDLIGVVQVTVDGVTKTYQGEDLIFYVDEGTQYTISSNIPNGYAVTNNSTGTYAAQFWGSREATITYNTEIVTVTTQQSGVALYVNGVIYTQPVKIAYGETYTVTGENIIGYRVSSKSFTASQVSRTVEVVYTEKVNGVFIYTDTGELVSRSNWDSANNSSAVGVAVITDACSFVIGKTNILAPWDSSYSSNGVIFGVTAANTSTYSKLDYNGVANTNIMRQKSSGCEAAKACYNTTIIINGLTIHGYLGGCGEWNLAGSNMVSVEFAMSDCGGDLIYRSLYWTSTLTLDDGFAWRYLWGILTPGSTSTDRARFCTKTTYDYVRPFYELQ